MLRIFHDYLIHQTMTCKAINLHYSWLTPRKNLFLFGLFISWDTLNLIQSIDKWWYHFLSISWIHIIYLIIPYSISKNKLKVDHLCVHKKTDCIKSIQPWKLHDAFFLLIYVVGVRSTAMVAMLSWEILRHHTGK